jgi:hypothetical protein
MGVIFSKDRFVKEGVVFYQEPPSPPKDEGSTPPPPAVSPPPTNEFDAKKVSKVRQHHSDASYSVEGMTEGHFAVASSKKHLKQLMKSEADLVYYQKKGNLYLNNNGELKGWGKKKVGGLVARFKGKPELEAGHFEGMKLFDSDEVTGHPDGDGGDTPMETMFPSRKAAKKAAKNFGCKGAHQMGDSWMPCKQHGAMMIEDDVHSGNEHSGYESPGYDYSGYDYSGY